MADLNNNMISRLMNYGKLNESITEAPAPAATDAAPKQKPIIFKCPQHTGNDERYLKAVKSVVDKKSLEYTGVAISSIFVSPNGDFNLYGKTYFYGKDGLIYYFEGRDTENWKGFKVLIAPSVLNAETATPEQLAKIKRVDETITLAPPAAAGAGAIGSFTFKGRADMPNRLTNRMGDNPMVDDTAKEVDEQTSQSPVINDSVLNDVKRILNNIGISDADIAVGNVRLKSAQSCIKLIKQATGKVVSDTEATQLCAQLVDQLSMKLSEDLTSDGNDEELTEFFDMPSDSRFTYTIDALGNVLIKDTQADTSVFLRGQDAVEFLGKLEMEGKNPEEIQKVLGYYQHVMEAGDEQSIDEDVQMSDYFGSTTEAVDAIKDLMIDIDNMKAKMVQLRGTSQHQGDVNGRFAAETIYDEIAKLEHAITDYVSKMTD